MEKFIRNPRNSVYFLSGHLEVIKVQDKMYMYVHEIDKEEASGNGPGLLEALILF